MKKFSLFLIIFLNIVFISKPLMAGVAPITNDFNKDARNYNVKLQIFNFKKGEELKKEDKVAEFMVALADSDKRREYGLMNLPNLPQNQGMLFLFNSASVVNMWMKDTKISLDMIFIDENDEIVHIETYTKPFSLKIISSRKPVKKILEINAGLTNLLRIKIGQKIVTTEE